MSAYTESPNSRSLRPRSIKQQPASEEEYEVSRRLQQQSHDDMKEEADQDEEPTEDDSDDNHEQSEYQTPPPPTQKAQPKRIKVIQGKRDEKASTGKAKGKRSSSRSSRERSAESSKAPARKRRPEANTYGTRRSTRLSGDSQAASSQEVLHTQPQSKARQVQVQTNLMVQLEHEQVVSPYFRLASRSVWRGEFEKGREEKDGCTYIFDFHPARHPY